LPVVNVKEKLEAQRRWNEQFGKPQDDAEEESEWFFGALWWVG
jgi:hypothetical protein